MTSEFAQPVRPSHSARALALLLLLAFNSSARAEFIRPDSATASTEFTSGFDGRAINTINGSGLPTSFSPSDAHADYATGNHWVTTGGTPTNEFITWEFSTPENLDTIYLWNHRSTLPTAANSGYDVVLFDLILRDASNQVLLSLQDVSLAPDLATAQAISFGGTISGVSSVRFDIEATQSSTTYTGLAEVGFNRAAAVPEPSTATALAGAAALIWTSLLRRRRAL
ncbi:MAG: PEP-CTERM sorting domain-containing protein [Burkholderiales bacterium]|nr:PEP-CTERM sorting domain-containing protein [Opitutaceae bacterium]